MSDRDPGRRTRRVLELLGKSCDARRPGHPDQASALYVQALQEGQAALEDCDDDDS